MHEHADNPNLVADESQLTAVPGTGRLIRSIFHHFIDRRAIDCLDRCLAALGGALGQRRSETLTTLQPCRRVAFLLQARDHDLVVGPAERRAPRLYRVSLNGPLADGLDTDSGRRRKVDDQGNMRAIRYERVRQPGTSAYLFEAEFDDPEVERYIDTFG